MKVKCIDLANEYDSAYLTIGKVYEVIEVDADRDFWVTDDVGETYILHERECEVVDE